MSAEYEDQRPRPPVIRRCVRCRVTPLDVETGYVVVSPTGIAHHGEDNGDTTCGKDATGNGWWWPL